MAPAYGGGGVPSRVPRRLCPCVRIGRRHRRMGGATSPERPHVRPTVVVTRDRHENRPVAPIDEE